MPTSFQFVALPFEPFASLFEASDAALAAIGARRVAVDETPGFPCRVSLVDAEIGETVVLLSWTHHDVDGPYRATGPIYVRESAVRATPAPGEVPALLRHRLLSVRGYAADGIMRAAEVMEGTRLEDGIARLFDDARIAYLDVHNARPGCFNCRVLRA